MSRLIDVDERITVASSAWVAARLDYAEASRLMSAAVRELAARGVSEVQLAAEFNTTRTTIRSILGKPRPGRP